MIGTPGEVYDHPASPFDLLSSGERQWPPLDDHPGDIVAGEKLIDQPHVGGRLRRKNDYSHMV